MYCLKYKKKENSIIFALGRNSPVAILCVADVHDNISVFIRVMVDWLI